MSKDVFDKYLVFGGIEAGPKMFGGGLELATGDEELTAVEIAERKATHYVPAEVERHSVVDFDGVLRAFL